jgi:hypothetical protein
MLDISEILSYDFGYVPNLRLEPIGWFRDLTYGEAVPHHRKQRSLSSIQLLNLPLRERGKEQDDDPFVIGNYGYGELRSGNVLGASQTMGFDRK